MIGKVGRGEPPQYQVSTNERGYRVRESWSPVRRLTPQYYLNARTSAHDLIVP